MYLKSYFALFRAQTAPATVFCLVVPYLLAGGKDILIFSILFFLGHLLHFFTFGHNSVMDYWHDLRDPSKKHHPLISGAISYEKAQKIIQTGLSLISVVFILTILYFSKNAILSLTFLTLYLVFGHSYNDGLDHSTEYSWVPISICFTALTGVGWSMVKSFDSNLIFLLIWAFLTIFYQIAWEGNLKDLWNPSEVRNFLRKFAIFDEKGPLMIKGAIPLFFTITRLLGNSSILIILSLGLETREVISLIIFLILFSLTTFFETEAVLKILRYSRKISNRQKLLDEMGKAEAFEFFRLISLLGILGLPLIVYGLIWFVGMNKLLWGTRFGPKV